MTNTITLLNNGTTQIDVDFTDESVDLQSSTTIIGDEQKALNFLPIFEADLIFNNSHLFPQPEPIINEEGL